MEKHCFLLLSVAFCAVALLVSLLVGAQVLLLCELKVPFEFKVSGFSYEYIVSGLQSLSCAGPEAAANLIPEAPEGCVLRRFFRADSNSGNE
eukprot:7190436-Alexandrium_andersonii.AAC.1